MKTTISLPDPLHARAEKLSKRLGISRSELYARALDAYLRQLEERAATETYDRVYADVPQDRRELLVRDAALAAWDKEENDW